MLKHYITILIKCQEPSIWIIWLYTRARRRGLNAMNLEIAMICCGFNLHKFHLKKIAIEKAA